MSGTWLSMIMEGVDERGERILIYFNHFVFALIDGAFNSVSFVVVHGVAYREASHEVGDPWLAGAEIFAQDEVEVIGVESEGMESGGSGAKY